MRQIVQKQSRNHRQSQYLKHSNHPPPNNHRPIKARISPGSPSPPRGRASPIITAQVTYCLSRVMWWRHVTRDMTSRDRGDARSDNICLGCVWCGYVRVLSCVDMWECYSTNTNSLHVLDIGKASTSSLGIKHIPLILLTCDSALCESSVILLWPFFL